jgi:hypothetical protein
MVESQAGTNDVVSEAQKKPINKYAIVGLILGITSAFSCFVLSELLGIIPIAAIVASILGLTSAKDHGGRGWFPAIIGLILGISYTFLHMVAYGYIW